MVRGLSAGGKWIRTIGTWKISFRFETDFRRIRDDSGFPNEFHLNVRSNATAHARRGPRRGKLRVCRACFRRTAKSCIRARCVEGRRRAASPLIIRSPFGPHNARNSRCRPRRADFCSANHSIEPGCGTVWAGCCESAPKRTPTSDRTQLLDTLKEFLFQVGSRSAPIGTPTSDVLADDFSDLLLFWPGSRFGADSHHARSVRRTPPIQVLTMPTP